MCVSPVVWVQESETLWANEFGGDSDDKEDKEGEDKATDKEDKDDEDKATDKENKDEDTDMSLADETSEAGAPAVRKSQRQRRPKQYVLILIPLLPSPSAQSCLRISACRIWRWRLRSQRNKKLNLSFRSCTRHAF